ncbi:circumsporozoite protein-like [Dendrobium catenatum]|uniref:circumsporozoite protein-like n=1 Tax=Dendrobium catenatum TaxID=906689 RepID=UPI0010A010E8|nr:circumsporozoite protein-like [Dendrobium catenatum]
MGRGGGLRSPPPNEGNVGGGGKGGGGRKERRQGNRWQVFANELADGEELAEQGERGGGHSRSPGVGRFSANQDKGADALAMEEEKKIKTGDTICPGKENVRDLAKGKVAGGRVVGAGAGMAEGGGAGIRQTAAGAASARLAAGTAAGAAEVGQGAACANPGAGNNARSAVGRVAAAAATQTAATKLGVAGNGQVTTFPEGKFAPGITSSITKPTAVRELIMSSIGMSPPLGAMKAAVQVQSETMASAKSSSIRASQPNSPRTDSCGMDDDQPGESERDFAFGSDDEDYQPSSPRDEEHIATGSEGALD